MQLLPLSLLDRLAALLPEPYRKEVLVGFSALQLPAAKLGIEMLEMEAAGVAYADAVRGEGRFPLIARFHHGVFDALQYELPAVIAAQVREVVRAVGAGNLDGIRKDLFLVAIGATGAAGGFFRALFIEALWFNVWLANFEDGGRREASGCMDAAFGEAEDILALAKTDPLIREHGVRPLEVLVGGLQERVDAIWTQIAPQIVKQSEEFQRRFMAAARASSEARGLGAHDAAIVRGIGEEIRCRESVGSQRLVDRHASLFASVNAVDQRLRRLVTRRADRKPPKQTGTRLIDILFETFTEQST